MQIEPIVKVTEASRCIWTQTNCTSDTSAWRPGSSYTEEHKIVSIFLSSKKEMVTENTCHIPAMESCACSQSDLIPDLDSQFPSSLALLMECISVIFHEDQYASQKSSQKTILHQENNQIFPFLREFPRERPFRSTFHNYHLCHQVSQMPDPQYV